MLSRREFLVLGAVGTAAAMGTWATAARATVARALTVGELVHLSQHALVGTSVDGSSRWETVGRRSRIVSYSVLRVDHSLDGRTPRSAEVVVRTLGGRVGDIGQAVPGEAVLQRGAAATVFLAPLASDVFVVTGMAQGHYPLRADPSGVRRLQRAVRAQDLVDDAAAAVRRLHGLTVGEAERVLSEELARGGF